MTSTGRRGALGIVTVLAAAVGSLGCSAPGTSAGGTLTPPAGDGVDAAAGPLSLPLTVSDDFLPTGFMGDSPTDFNAITMSSDSSQCPARVSGAVGVCYSVTWAPVLGSGASSAWVGVYWQYPGNNWGALPGRPVQPGASKVTFAAAGVAGGEQVQFIVGGVNTTPGASSDAGLTHADSFKAAKTVTLTATWATYEIPITGDTYEDVIGGFAWSITTASSAPVGFYVDDIQWEP
jgi:hypothetical protein